MSCTISGWLKKTLKQTGINTDLFKDHSTRSASGSKASVCGAPLVDILKRGSWSHHSTWQKFYNKHIIQKGHVFQIMVYKESGKSLRFKQRTGELGSTQLSELRSGEFSSRSWSFYEIKFSNYIRARCAHNVVPIL